MNMMNGKTVQAMFLAVFLLAPPAFAKAKKPKAPEPATVPSRDRKSVV